MQVKKVFIFCIMVMFMFSTMSLVSAEESTVKSRVDRVLASDDAPVVAVFVYLDPNGVSDPVKSSELIFNDLKQELDSTKNKVNVISFEKSQKILRNYIRENGSASTMGEAGSGFVPKKKDLAALAAEAEADYVLYINSRITDKTVKYNVWSGVRAQQTLAIEVLLIDKDATDYIIDEMFAETGKGTFLSFDRAFNKALEKVLEKIDLSKVDFKKID